MKRQFLHKAALSRLHCFHEEGFLKSSVCKKTFFSQSVAIGWGVLYFVMLIPRIVSFFMRSNSQSELVACCV